MADASEAADDPRDHVVVDHRPWGSFRRYTSNQVSTVKIIEVAPHALLSLQRHEHRDEFWVVLDDGLTVQIGDQHIVAGAGEEFFIPRGTVHRIGGAELGGRFLEICLGDFDEDDIERLEDEYGRA